jgi:hypothetical protein
MLGSAPIRKTKVRDSNFSTCRCIDCSSCRSRSRSDNYLCLPPCNCRCMEARLNSRWHNCHKCLRLRLPRATSISQEPATQGPATPVPTVNKNATSAWHNPSLTSRWSIPIRRCRASEGPRIRPLYPQTHELKFFVQPQPLAHVLEPLAQQLPVQGGVAEQSSSLQPLQLPALAIAEKKIIAARTKDAIPTDAIAA